jgi:hypothetical protein
VKSVLAGSAARIEHRSGESTLGCQTHDRRLRPADIPRRGAVVVRRIPRQSRHPFVTGWTPTTERIVSHRFVGCHSSIFVPSGSRIQANLPFGSESSRLRTATPFAFRRARNASRSSTAKSSMKSRREGAR